MSKKEQHNSKKDASMDIKTINLFDKAILKQHNITQHSKQWKALAQQQRLMRLNVSTDTATYLIDKGFYSANHIASMPLEKFLHSCQDFPDSTQLEDAYNVAQSIRSASMHMMVNVKNLHSSGKFSKTKAYSADPEMFASFEDLPSYEMLFGDLDYYDCSKFSSIFSPVAYLLDLLGLRLLLTIQSANELLKILFVRLVLTFQNNNRRPSNV